MDRKEQVKFSLRDVVGIGDEGPSLTRSLMESRGLSPTQIVKAQSSRPMVADIIREAIENGTIPILEDCNLQPADRTAQRDDITLQRWREMAGLED